MAHGKTTKEQPHKYYTELCLCYLKVSKSQKQSVLSKNFQKNNELFFLTNFAPTSKMGQDIDIIKQVGAYL